MFEKMDTIGIFGKGESAPNYSRPRAKLKPPSSSSLVFSLKINKAHFGQLNAWVGTIVNNTPTAAVESNLSRHLARSTVCKRCRRVRKSRHRTKTKSAPSQEKPRRGRKSRRPIRKIRRQVKINKTPR